MSWVWDDCARARFYLDGGANTEVSSHVVLVVLEDQELTVSDVSDLPLHVDEMMR